MIAPRDVLLFGAILWPSLRLPIALVDRALEAVGYFDPPAGLELSERIEAFRAEVEAKLPELGELTRGQALDALEAPGPTSAAAALGLYSDADPGARARIVAGVELARRTTQEAV